MPFCELGSSNAQQAADSGRSVSGEAGGAPLGCLHFYPSFYLILCCIPALNNAARQLFSPSSDTLARLSAP